MDPRPRPGRTDLGVGLRWSFYLHGGVILFVLLKSVAFPTSPKVFAPSLRVDLVGLPDLLKKDLVNVPKLPATKDPPTKVKTPEAEVEKPEPDEMLLKPKKADPREREKKLKSALDRMKALEKIQNAEREETKKKIREVAIPVIKGNTISKGTSLSGAARENAEASYYDEIRERIQGNWVLNAWLARQKFAATVQIFVDARGKILNYRFTKTSGNPAFDDAVKAALSRSQPLPAPPPELAAGVLADGISVGFPL